MSDENILWRAQTYALLAHLLALEPDQTLLDNLIAIDVEQPESPMGKKWVQFIAVVKDVDVTLLKDEYQDLFIGVTQGKIIPYSSYYQTGFLMEEPLAELRTDLSQLGLERQGDTTEPEDHAAAECDVMRLILMAEGTPVVNDAVFFKRHLQPWMETFFHDLSKVDDSSFYRALGQFGKGFIQLELAHYR